MTRELAAEMTLPRLTDAEPRPRRWYIAHRAYDLTPWLALHPGGMESLRHAEGTDCTELFRTYHLMREPAARMLARYEVTSDAADPRHVEGIGGSHFTFEDDGFYRTVQRRVKTYFLERRTSVHAGLGAQLVASALILLAIGLLVPAFVRGSILCALLLGAVKTLAAIGPGHSMSHFSLYPRGRWNLLAFRLASPFLVSNPATWSASHIQSHHVHTLTEDDLQDNYPLKRVQPRLRHRAWHRAQHLYIWPVYLLALPLWSLSDLVASITGLFHDRSRSRVSLLSRLESGLVAAANLFFSVGLPFCCLEPRRALLVCLLVNLPSSFFLVIQIAVNHEVPETMSQVVPGEAIDWGIHQVRTSHNFAVGSRLALHASGGLNMQIEHHLFPSVHYGHYPAISAIVRSACAEFGLPYHTSTSLWQAMAKHYRVLKTNSVA